MVKPRWESWSDTARREALAVAVVVATTFGGWGVVRAQATPAPPTKASAQVATVVATTPAAKVDDDREPIEVIFDVRDILERLHYQLGFEPEARDQFALASACADLLAQKSAFHDALEGDVGDKLRGAAAPSFVLCGSPGDVGTDQAIRASEAYRTFWETSFDAA